MAMSRTTALTGTPGTGKSSVARRLAGRFRVVEVRDLARKVGAVRRRGASVEVDLDALSRAVRRPVTVGAPELIVGHLAHLLPLREAIVLRCHPNELLARLRRARRGTPANRQSNYVCEATDSILIEARRLGRRVFEIDTTNRTVEAVARDVARHLRGRGPARSQSIDWLADAAVTAHLLDRPT
ncbi:MAG TPA: AAA family ATPase [Thermoplasmata archaeon]|nr:AAA family ATPase [Thermoplasmata archaeon]